MLEKEYYYYLKNKKTLKQDYRNRVIVIKGKDIIGDYDTKEEALLETVKEHELGTFLIQDVSEEDIEYIRSHSQVYENV
jgi:hypothetical protein